ncbi:adenylate kinase [bacterium BMS3Abin15]|nr:adenylate kinase [bacterium BMS3Abin15]HDZ85008.1 nucleoside monophosphate kinase [Candidatus Moranbacteria bacterium]
MNLVIIGPQGCGKGTQAKLLAEKFNLAHIEMGSSLREQAKEDTPLGKELDEIINKKKELAPDDVIVRVISEQVSRAPAEKGIILDGAPRTISQVEKVAVAFKDNDRKLDKVIFIKLSEAESIERISMRVGCSNCGKNMKIGKDVKGVNDRCPDCGGELNQRKDDTPEGVKKRLDIFNQETVPVVEYYRNQGILLEINGEQDVDGVFKDIASDLEKYE